MKLPCLLPTKLEEIKDCYLAGGAVLSHLTKKPIEDYDIYPKNTEGLYSVIDALTGAGEIVNVTDRAITAKLYETNSDGKRIIAQVVINQFYPTAESIFETFDFTPCMVAVDIETREFYSADTAMMDIASRTLRVNVGTRYPFASLARAGKYGKKGYTVPKAEFMKLGLAVAAKGMPQSWEELEEAIGGSYGRQCRINVDDDTPCTFEKMVEVLSGFEDLVWSEVEAQEDYSWITPDVVCALVDTETHYRYMKVDEGIMVFEETGYNFYIKTGAYLTTHSDRNKFDRFFTEDGSPRNPNWKEVGDDYLIRTFKYVTVTDDPNVFKPCMQTKSEIRYKTGEFTAEHKSPYIYSGKNIGGYGNTVYWTADNAKRVCLEILIRPSDVKAFPQGGQHIQSSAIYVKGILPEGFKDYSISLIENPYGSVIYSSPSNESELDDLDDDDFGLR